MQTADFAVGIVHTEMTLSLSLNGRTEKYKKAQAQACSYQLEHFQIGKLRRVECARARTRF